MHLRYIVQVSLNSVHACSRNACSCNAYRIVCWWRIKDVRRSIIILRPPLRIQDLGCPCLALHRDPGTAGHEQTNILLLHGCQKETTRGERPYEKSKPIIFGQKQNAHAEESNPVLLYIEGSSAEMLTGAPAEAQEIVTVANINNE